MFSLAEEVSYRYGGFTVAGPYHPQRIRYPIRIPHDEGLFESTPAYFPLSAAL
jgi:hypothetical protein